MSNDKKLAVELVEIELAQIGNELHDGVIPLLFVASSTVANLRAKLASGLEDFPSTSEGGELSPVLDQLSGWLDEAMQASRRLLTDTYPPDLDERDWQVAVTDTLERLFPDFSGRVRWDVEPVVNQVSHAVACAVYRIVLEAVRNAWQHGDAAEVLVSGREAAKSIEVTIHDNGTGFEPGRVAASHFGIRAMRGRAELVSGKLNVDSALGGPTTVTLVVPVADDS